MARELEKLYDRVYGERGLLYDIEMTTNMLSFYKELAQDTEKTELDSEKSED
jgi:hypothetical protein